MRVLFRMGCVALVAVTLAACANKRFTATADNTKPQQRLAISPMEGVEKTSITTFLRVFNDLGSVGVCGAFAVVGQDKGVAQVRERFLQPDSRLLIGDDISITPWFMNQMFHPASEMKEDSVKFVIGSVPDKCIRLEKPWDPKLATAKFKLNFTK